MIYIFKVIYKIIDNENIQIRIEKTSDKFFANNNTICGCGITFPKPYLVEKGIIIFYSFANTSTRIDKEFIFNSSTNLYEVLKDFIIEIGDLDKLFHTIFKTIDLILLDSELNININNDELTCANKG